MALVLATLALLSVPATAQEPGLPAPWDAVGTILQSPGGDAGGYYRYNFPRRDITLRLGDVTVAPALALGSWAGFAGNVTSATMMGDLVVTGSELARALAEFDRQQIGVTAVHNHLAGEEPRLFYVHFHGEGPPADLARRFSAVLAVTGTPRPVAAAAPARATIDTAVVFRGLGRSGRASGAVAQLGFQLVRDTVRIHGRAVVPAMGFGTPINIQEVSPGRAVATGDFAVLAAQVAQVLHALVAHGITATAVHSHLGGESPTVYYIHFWADGSLPDLVTGLRAAIDAAR